jgi:transcriptional regulator with XRE-family HTH domain
MKAKPMPRPPLTAPEHEKALWWRKVIVNMTRAELSALVGVSESRIADIENGKTRGSGAVIDQDTMTRYRMACAAVSLGVQFDWTSCTLKPVTRAEIRLDMEIQLPPPQDDA